MPCDELAKVPWSSTLKPIVAVIDSSQLEKYPMNVFYIN